MRKIQINKTTLINDYNKGLSTIVLAQKHHCTSTTIINRLKQYHIKRRKMNDYNKSFDIFEQNQDNIWQKYSKENWSLEKIASCYNYSRETLKKYFSLKKKKIHFAAHIQKYVFNKKYFVKPNLQNCYWAGFITADGNLSDTSNKRLVITLAEKDINLLTRFKKDIHYTGKIYYFQKKPNNGVSISLNDSTNS